MSETQHSHFSFQQDYIVNVHGFPETEGLMTILLDDDEHKHPTHLNITEAFKSLSEQSQPGDAVFIQFSGHGGRMLDSTIDSEAESYDEVIVPSDYKISGLIRDTLIFKTLLAPMKYGVTVTILIDCCDTGMILDLPFRWSTHKDKAEDTVAKLAQNDDFSYVRFLKVVRTLYESSTFTQLGKTVGSVLNTSPNQSATSPKQIESVTSDTEAEEDTGDEEDEEALEQDMTVVTRDEGTLASASKTEQISLFSSLVSCTSPAGAASNKSKNNKKSKKDKKSSQALVPFEEQSEVASPRSQSLLEQMLGTRTPLVEQLINCTLAHGEDDYSDDDTFASRTIEGSYSLGGSSTFDTFTDDGCGPGRHRRGQRGTNRRRSKQR